MAKLDITRIKEERAKVWARMQEIVDRSTEADTMTVDDRAAYDAAEVDFRQLTVDADRLERHAELESKFGTTDAPVIPRQERAVPEVDDETRYANAFRNMARYGKEHLSPEDRSLIQGTFGAFSGEQRAQSIGTNSAGGYLVPPGYLHRITEVMKAYGGLLNIANVIDTDSGNPLQWPNNDDTANLGAILGENVQVTEVDTTIGTRTLSAYVYTTNLILASNQLLQDSAFNLDEWLPKKMATRWGRAIANHLVNGTGTAQPTGILPGVTAGKTGLVGQTLTVIYDDLVDLIHSVDPAYRQLGNCRYFMSDASLGVVAKIKSTQGYPIFNPSPNVGQPDTILGYPVQIDQAMPTMAANTKSILFGDFHAGYLVRRVTGQRLIRLEERYADYNQVGFVGFTRLDARPDDPNAVKSYVNSAT